MMKIDLAGYRKTEQPSEIPPVIEEPDAGMPIPEEAFPNDEPPLADELDSTSDDTVFLNDDTGDAGVTAETGPATPTLIEEREAIPEMPAEPGGEDFTLLRSGPPALEKVPLSSNEPLPEPVVPPPPAPVTPEEPATSTPQPMTDAETISRKKPRSSRILVLASILLLAAAAGYALWSQWDVISGFIGLKQSKPKTAAFARSGKMSAPSRPSPAAPKDVETPAQAKRDSATAPSSAKAERAAAPSVPAAPPSQAPSRGKPAPMPASSDAALNALSTLNRATPPRVWLTAVTVTSEGAYELKGMSFSHEAMTSFGSTLSSSGTVASSTLPPRASSPETIYSFAVTGKLSGIASTGVLDVIPSNLLAALGDSLKTHVSAKGVTFGRLPRADARYGETDLPFEAAGPYESVMAMIGGITASGKIAAGRIAINPAVSGGSFNHVRVGFSLRMVSSL